MTWRRWVTPRYRPVDSSWFAAPGSTVKINVETYTPKDEWEFTDTRLNFYSGGVFTAFTTYSLAGKALTINGSSNISLLKTVELLTAHRLVVSNKPDYYPMGSTSATRQITTLSR